MVNEADLMKKAVRNGLMHWFVVLLIAVPFFSFAQSQQLHFTHLGTVNGLSELNPNSILQDSRGFIWVGTADGLNRYDGYKFRVFRNDVKDTTTIGNNYIQNIVEDRDGNLWIATVGGGLNKYDRRTNRFHRYQHDETNNNSVSSDFISKVAIDDYGKIWAATQHHGINVLDPKTGIFRHYRSDKNNPNSLSDDEIMTIYRDSHNNIWVGTVNDGLCMYDRKKAGFTSYKHSYSDKSSLSGNKVTAIFEDSEGA